MSIEGRMTVDIVYHDKDGSVLKVLEMEDTESHTTGKAALVTGTAGTNAVTINHTNTGYSDATGTVVNFTTITRLALKSSRDAQLTDNGNTMKIRSTSNRIAFSHSGGNCGNLTLTPNYTSGTSSYTVFIYGT